MHRIMATGILRHGFASMSNICLRRSIIRCQRHGRQRRTLADDAIDYQLRSLTRTEKKELAHRLLEEASEVAHSAVGYVYPTMFKFVCAHGSVCNSVELLSSLRVIKQCNSWCQGYVNGNSQTENIVSFDIRVEEVIILKLTKITKRNCCRI